MTSKQHTAQLLAWQHLNRVLGKQPVRLFVPDDGPEDDLCVASLGTPQPTVNLRKPRAVR